MDINIKPLDTIAETAKDFLQKVITPPLEEVGLMFADQVKFWRFKNQVSILSKADEYLRVKGIKTRKVSLKIMAPLLEEASLEEDEGLQEKWASLLTNTVREGSEINTTLFIHVLSQMMKADAESFERIANYCTSTHKSDVVTVTVKEYRVFHLKDLRKDNKEADLIIDNLIRLRLIKEVKTHSIDTEIVTLTDLGFRFVTACKTF